MPKFFGLMPIFPSLVIFGFGILFLHFGKKQKSRWLKIGGYVLSIGAILMMLLSIYFFVMKPKAGCPCMGGVDDEDMGFRHKRHMQFMMDNNIQGPGCSDSSCGVEASESQETKK